MTHLKFKNGEEDETLQVRSLVRASLRKMPFFWFSNFSKVQGNPTFLISKYQYMELMRELWYRNPEYKQRWKDDFESQYQWEDHIPKQNVFVKLNPGISDD